LALNYSIAIRQFLQQNTFPFRSTRVEVSLISQLQWAHRSSAIAVLLFMVLIIWMGLREVQLA